jgi:hypothetical protein
LLLVTIRIALSVLPLRTVRGVLSRCRSATRRDDAQAARIVAAVKLSGRSLPGFGTCLTQTLVANLLLGRVGVSSEVRIGVAKEGSNRLIAHAWLESEGRILIGGLSSTLARYPLQLPVSDKF